MVYTQLDLNSASSVSPVSRPWNGLIINVNVCLARMRVDEFLGHLMLFSPSLSFLKCRMVLETSTSPWILVYTVKRPVCLLISMICGVCQLPTVLRQRLSWTVIWRLLSKLVSPTLMTKLSRLLVLYRIVCYSLQSFFVTGYSMLYCTRLIRAVTGISVLYTVLSQPAAVFLNWVFRVDTIITLRFWKETPFFWE